MATSILCLNAGSSSLKFKVFELLTSGLSVVCNGVCERVGQSDTPTAPNFHAQAAGHSPVENVEPFDDHVAALKRVERYLTSDLGVRPEQVVAVGHRVVMGRDHDAAVLVDDKVKREIEEGAVLAPLHNPPNLLGIAAAEVMFPAARQVAVFDTAFHTTMPRWNKTYALPRRLADKYGIRRYGFHGTSYRWLTEQAAAQLGKDVGDVNLVLLHLGAGASMCAVKGGKCLDTTMGLTPTAGLVMATRCGDIDPSVVAFLVDKEGMTANEVESVLNYESGLVGMCGLKDIRDVHAAERRGEAAATEALEVYVARIRGYLGSYVFQLGGRVDAVVFSAGVGEHDAEVRRRVLEGMEWAGLALDEAKNDAAVDGRAARIDRGGTVVPILVVPTDEERSIAMQVIEQLCND